MLVLALDTATRAGSCALARDGVVMDETPGDQSQSHGSRLPGELMVLLDRAGLALRDVECYAVATGPGSFTGLRVGIATMQGLSFAGGKPLIGISALDALAFVAVRQERLWQPHTAVPTSEPRTGTPPLVATWIDAWRGEVYAALYAESRAIEPPTVTPPSSLLARLLGAPTRFIGDGAETYRTQIELALGAHAQIAEPAVPLLAGAIALLATESAARGERPLPHAIRPLYVRRPDAELARDARAGH